MREPAAHTALIAPFYVMEIVKAAARLQAEGRSIIHMSIGEPDFSAPEPVQEAAIAAISRGATRYSPALGLDTLRQNIAAHYDRAYGLAMDPASAASAPTVGDSRSTCWKRQACAWCQGGTSASTHLSATCGFPTPLRCRN